MHSLPRLSSFLYYNPCQGQIPPIRSRGRYACCARTTSDQLLLSGLDRHRDPPEVCLKRIVL